MSKDEAGIDKKTLFFQCFLSVCILATGIIISLIFAAEPHSISDCNYAEVKTVEERKPTYWVFSQNSDVESETGILKHVHLVLQRGGLKHGSNNTEWDLLWSHDFPFRILQQQMRNLKTNQLVNHFPGTGFITNKVDFATSQSSYIPPAFKIPEDKEKFLQYSSANPDSVYVLKDNQHRGVTIKDVKNIDFDKVGNFIQEYVTNPFLVDGHKFDIGVYTVITSVDPLRVYIYKGDVLFRYCPSKYYPFDPSDLDKYVIGDDYLPTWEVPSLAPLYTALGYGMKDSFDAYVRSQGKDPSVVWTQIDDFLGKMFLEKEHYITSALKNYRSGTNFFELMRFDFVIDEDLKVYALEANMSPNLSSAHFPPNQLLYEQVLHSVLSLVGVLKYTHNPTLGDRNHGESQMRASDKNIAVYSEICSSQQCKEDCNTPCNICRHCLTNKMKKSLSKAYIENMNKNDCRRVYPPPMKSGNAIDFEKLQELSLSNQIMYIWFQGKCNQDITWCN